MSDKVPGLKPYELPIVDLKRSIIARGRWFNVHVTEQGEGVIDADAAELFRFRSRRNVLHPLGDVTIRHVLLDEQTSPGDIIGVPVDDADTPVDPEFRMRLKYTAWVAQDAEFPMPRSFRPNIDTRVTEDGQPQLQFLHGPS